VLGLSETFGRAHFTLVRRSRDKCPLRRVMVAFGTKAELSIDRSSEDRYRARLSTAGHGRVIANSAMLQGFTALILGAGTTVLLSCLAIGLGMAAAVPLCLSRLSRRRWLRSAATAYVSFFRGVPLLVQLFIVYYFLPAIGLDLPPLVAAVIALGLCTAAYQSENLRGGFLIIPRGQVEAAHAFGYSAAQTRRHILIPQALRAAFPALLNEMIMILKASSPVSVVGVADLTRASQNIVARDLHPMQWYAAAGLVYLAINATVAALGRALERRLGAGFATVAS
jgi:polar amino acid transport system permease protein